MDAPELKPCPFCGGNAKLQEWENDGQTEQYTGIICLCGVEISGSVHWSDCDMPEVQSKSVAAWNRRTAAHPSFAEALQSPVTVEMLERWANSIDWLDRAVEQNAYEAWEAAYTSAKEIRAAIAQMKEVTEPKE